MNKTTQIIAAILIVLLGLLYNGKQLNKMPSHIHAWAQSDRYALALGFIDNHFNFFRPQVSIYNHQFPDKWMTPSGYRNTTVDFPMHDFIPALLMKLFGTRSPWVFRCYLLLYSFLGLIFLYKLFFLLSKHNGKSLLLTLAAATSPVFVYYQAGFLPTIPSLANAAIGIFFYLSFKENNLRRHFYLSVLFFTLAALSRTTFAIPLIALAGIEILSFMKQARPNGWKFLPLATGFALIGSYFLYNTWLRNRYGSDFLATPLPAHNLADAWEYTLEAIQRWGLHYFTLAHYVLFAIILLGAFYTKAKHLKTQNINLNSPVFFTAIYWLGSLLFAVLMIRQFPRHDYYFLDVFYLPVLLLFAILLAKVPFPAKWLKWMGNPAVIAFLSIPMIALAFVTQQERNAPQLWDKNHATVTNFSGSEAFLDSIGVTKSHKILVLDGVAPNLPFMLMNRTGYTLLATDKASTEKALRWDFDFIVAQNEFFYSDVYSTFPEIIHHLKPYASNQSISVYTLSEVPTGQTLEDFLGLDKKLPLYADSILTGQTHSENWSNVKTVSSEDGETHGHLPTTDEFSLTFKLSKPMSIAGKNRYVSIQALLKGKPENDCFIVVSVRNNNETAYYKTVNLKNQLKGEFWENQSYLFQIPNLPETTEELAIYLWNPGKNELFYKSLAIRIF